LYLDLDHFKDINDTLGHPAGDLVLRAVAERLQASVREVDTIARFGGDEFAILLNDVGEPENAALVSRRMLDAVNRLTAVEEDMAVSAAGVAEKIIKGVSEPIAIETTQVHTSASIGIAISEPDAADAETLLSRADVALYRAKAEQRGTYHFFTDGMDNEVRERVRIDAELRNAIAGEQFFLMYQPQVDIDTGRIVGLEALARWRHPTRGVVGPGHFIPEMERNGLIVPLGRWVMNEACREVTRWLDAGIALPLVAINLSGIQFKRPLDLERDIVAATVDAGVPPQYLELELTESVLMETSHAHNDLLLWLRERGHRIAIDDFGSGYSSLDYLRRYPVDRIKIAQKFIAEIGIEAGNDAIVRAALGLARELGIEVVVEGVETAAQVALLKTWGCRIVQGYYFARPLSVTDVTALLRVGKITPAPAKPVELAVS
jgi:predicted signal transduction protein with EAL and GGDEF domain